MMSICYSKIRGGSWIRTEILPRCSKLVLSCRDCQGTDGHEGYCWCYSEDGALWYDYNGKGGDANNAAGMISPDHKNYRQPSEMQKEHYRKFYTECEVTDPELIARLEKDKVAINESIIRPIE